MTARSKGKRNERKAAGLYEAAGYETYRPQESKWGETDIYGLFDILAIATTPAKTPVRLVQVKSNEARGIQAWAEEAEQYASRTVSTEFLVCHDYEGWRLILCRYPGREAVVDEREMDVPMGDGVVEYLQRGGENEP